MPKKGAIFRLTGDTREVIAKLAEKDQVSKSEIVNKAVWYYAKQRGINCNEQPLIY